MDADPMFFSALFDDSKLKTTTTGVYAQVFDAVSYGKMSADDGAKALYQGFMDVCKN